MSNQNIEEKLSLLSENESSILIDDEDEFIDFDEDETYKLVVKNSRKLLQYPVIKSNDFIRKSQFNLSVIENRIINFMLAATDPKQTKFKYVEFSLYDFHKACGLKTHNSTYTRDIIKQLADKSVAVKMIQIVNGESKEVYVPVRWIDDWKLNITDGTIRLKFHPRLKEYFLQLTQRYTKAELSIYLIFKCRYTSPIFDLLNSYTNMIIKSESKRIILAVSIEDLRDRLSLENKFDRFCDFKRRVLDPVISEINEQTHLNVSYDVKRYNKQVSSIRFVLSCKDIVDRIKIEDQRLSVLEQNFEKDTPEKDDCLWIDFNE
jgi:plasmid replication initiation protein